MGRIQQTPIKRESSSEFFDKTTASWQSPRDQANGKQHDGQPPIGSGHAATATAAYQPIVLEQHDKGEAGILQLIIAVAGIYASL